MSNSLIFHEISTSMNTLCSVRTNAFEFSYLKRDKTSRQVWESSEKSTPWEGRGIVFDLKMLAFMKISNTNVAFPNQILVSKQILCDILCISAAQAFWVFYLMRHFSVKFKICRSRERFSLLLFTKPTFYRTGFTRGHNNARSLLCFSAKPAKNVEQFSL